METLRASSYPSASLRRMVRRRLDTSVFGGFLGLQDWVWYCIIAGAALFFLLICICCCCCVRRAKRKGREQALRDARRYHRQQEMARRAQQPKNENVAASRPPPAAQQAYHQMQTPTTYQQPQMSVVAGGASGVASTHTQQPSQPQSQQAQYNAAGMAAYPYGHPDAIARTGITSAYVRADSNTFARDATERQQRQHPRSNASNVHSNTELYGDGVSGDALAARVGELRARAQREIATGQSVPSSQRPPTQQSIGQGRAVSHPQAETSARDNPRSNNPAGAGVEPWMIIDSSRSDTEVVASRNSPHDLDRPYESDTEERRAGGNQSATREQQSRPHDDDDSDLDDGRYSFAESSLSVEL